MSEELLIIGGPCSAETREQVLSIAKDIDQGNIAQWFRAGIWKPRTMPNQFEGVGSKGLKWLVEVKNTTSLKVMTEVANTRHIEKCIENGIDGIWIGARTTTNPFLIQELADCLKGIDIPIFIKNPLNPDINLWIGAIERFSKAGINNISAIHRGFSFVDNGAYRQTPYWQIPIELKRLMPKLPIICDPSHIAGNTKLIKHISQTAMNLNFDGLMIEVHNQPKDALTDKKQQITPLQLKKLIMGLVIPKTNHADLNSITALREEIDRLDYQLIDILKQRMELSFEVGKIKKANNISILQLKRWEEMIKTRLEIAENKNISKDFIKEIFESIHQESIRVQGNDK